MSAANRNKAGIDSMAVAEEAVDTTQFVDTFPGTFSITVKSDEEDSDGKKKTVYENDKEPYEFPKVKGGLLSNALGYFGAKLSDDQKTFIASALEGSDEAVSRVVEIIDSYLKDSAKANQYAKVLNDKKPLSEESLANSQARMVRDFMRQSNVTAEAAIETLKQFVPSMKEYTIVQFNANRGRV